MSLGGQSLPPGFTYAPQIGSGTQPTPNQQPYGQPYNTPRTDGSPLYRGPRRP